VRPIVIWSGTSAAAALIGIFGPWNGNLFVSRSGIEHPDGKVALYLLVGISVLVAFGVAARAAWPIVIAGLGTVLLGWLAITDIGSVGENVRWGLYLLALSAGSLFVSLLFLASAVSRERTVPPIVVERETRPDHSWPGRGR
jgi:hypothetical protein